ncbi:SusE domain-containing protein [Pedobacter sp. SYSU D00535]|uniref:SusE domain-containing protein n=1 Tax=Pedobacter sp. SYSU D00535 TaxID=2810308 RepID=UPI001A969D5B|nr:SusE domain-containing protein [Pedobacter sp. SYSU D00535]
MKKYIWKALLSLLVAVTAISCQKEGDMTMVSESVTPASLTAQNTNVVLSKQSISDTVATFSWTKADFGYQAGVLYTIEVDKKGNNFANPKSVPVGTFAADAAPKKAFNGLDFNNVLLALNLPTGVASQVELRVKSEVSTLGTVQSPAVSIAPVYSAPVTITATPFALVSYLYVPGAYQGWNPANADSLVSLTSNGIYEGVIEFTPGNLGFKVLTKKSWGPPEYGRGATAGSIAVGGGDLSAPNAGTLKVTVDLNANTIAFSRHSWGIIGTSTAGGWTTDTDMKYNNGTQTWSITTTLTPGVFKFRLNDDWGVNLGGSNGTLTAGGGDIAVTIGGTYKIELNTTANTYTLTKL